MGIFQSIGATVSFVIAGAFLALLMANLYEKGGKWAVLVLVSVLSALVYITSNIV